MDPRVPTVYREKGPGFSPTSTRRAIRKSNGVGDLSFLPRNPTDTPPRVSVGSRDRESVFEVVAKTPRVKGGGAGRWNPFSRGSRHLCFSFTSVFILLIRIIKLCTAGTIFLVFPVNKD